MLGHWEGNLRTGSVISYIATLVARQSRCTLQVNLEAGDKPSVVAAFAREIRKPRSSAQVAHVRSRLGTRRTPTNIDGNQDAYLFLRPEKSLATLHKSEHASISAAVLAKENRSRGDTARNLISHCLEAK